MLIGLSQLYWLKPISPFVIRNYHCGKGCEMAIHKHNRTPDVAESKPTPIPELLHLLVVPNFISEEQSKLVAEAERVYRQFCDKAPSAWQMIERALSDSWVRRCTATNTAAIKVAERLAVGHIGHKRRSGHTAPEQHYCLALHEESSHIIALST